MNTALYRADAISLTKHFEGREAPDKAPDKAPGPPFNWQMELIGPTGLKWARALTFQRTEAGEAQNSCLPEQVPACLGWELSPLTASSSTLLCFPEIKNPHIDPGSAGPCYAGLFYNHFNLSNIPFRNCGISSYFLEQMIVIFSPTAAGIYHRLPSQVLCHSSEVISSGKISICCAERGGGEFRGDLRENLWMWPYEQSDI